MFHTKNHDPTYKNNQSIVCKEREKYTYTLYHHVKHDLILKHLFAIICICSSKLSRNKYPTQITSTYSCNTSTRASNGSDILN